MSWDRNWACRIEADSRVRGWSAVTLQNRFVRMTILVDKGCDVVELLYKPLDLDVTPRTRRGLRRRAETLAAPWSEMGAFLDQYEGGWQEILPAGGPPDSYQGAQFPQHGESSRLPWKIARVRDSEERVSVDCFVRLSVMPLVLEKTFELTESSSEVVITSAVTNESEVRLPIMWGHHLAFGAPFIGPGAEVSFPEGTTYSAYGSEVYDSGRRSDGSPGLWPSMRRFDGELIDMRKLPSQGEKSDLHFLRPSAPTFSLTNASRTLSLNARWDRDVHPYVWFWQEFGAAKSYPWWGGEYLIGLEPWSSDAGSGISEAVANNSALWLDPGERAQNTLAIDLSEDPK